MSAIYRCDECKKEQEGIPLENGTYRFPPTWYQKGVNYGPRFIQVCSISCIEKLSENLQETPEIE